MSIKVVNKYHHLETKGDIYIGRGSILGNPYTHLPNSQFPGLIECATRDEAIDSYAKYAGELMTFDNEYSAEIKRLRELSKTKDLVLVCFCKSSHTEVRCHGDVIKNLIETDND